MNRIEVSPEAILIDPDLLLGLVEEVITFVHSRRCGGRRDADIALNRISGGL